MYKYMESYFICSYLGGWKNDLKEGKGEYRWSNGNRFNGDYYKDKPHGSGVYRTTKGDSYIGEFANGRFQGTVL